jgi:hypothetical protein
MSNTFFADSSETRVALIEESTWGTTPTAPTTFKTMRVTSESLSVETETVTGSELRADRNVAHLINASKATGGSIEMELNHDDVVHLLMESALQGAFSSDKLINGVAQKSFTLERTFSHTSNGTSGETYVRHTGMTVDTMGLTMSAGSMITASFGFLGKEATTDTVIIGSGTADAATYTAASTTPPLSASKDFASLTMTGITSPKISSLSLNTTNNLRRQQGVGVETSVGLGSGRFEVTGSMDFYMENKDVLDDYLGGTATSLAFTIGAASGAKYTFTIPTVKFETVSINAGGNDQDVFVSAGWRGLFNTDVDSGTGGNQGGTMMITRNVS